MRTVRFAALLFLLIAGAPLAAAEELSRPLMLVAKPELRDPMYGQTVLAVKPFGKDQHIGFIVNRPSKVTLGQLFPRHAPSRKVADPVYVGGPISAESIFALVQTRKHPGGRSVELMPGMYAVFDGNIVDEVIEHEAGRARFVAGLVGWRAGELRDEVSRGAWFVLVADPKIVLRKPEGLWEEMVRRAEQLANSI